MAAARQRREDASTARAGVQAEIEAAKYDRKRFHMAREQAAMAVIAKHAEQSGLSDEVERAQRDAYGKGLRLWWLNQAGLIAAKRETLDKVNAYQGFWDLDNVESLREWTAARERLMVDPTAEILE